jgi:ABC-2 type transport system permease protein
MLSLSSGVRRSLTLAWLESLTIRRDPIILAMILLIPTLQIALFGYALRPFGGEVPVAIARAEDDRATLALFKDNGDFKIVADRLTRGTALAEVKNGKALMGVVVPPASEPSETKDDSLTVYVDDSDSIRANPALSKFEATYWQQAGGSKAFPRAKIRVQRLYNPDNRNDWVMTPGLSGVILMISMLMLGALSIVRERERGTWEALLSTPVTASEAIVGKALPYLFLGFVQAALVVGCSRVLFGLPLRGDLPAFGLFIAVYIFAHLVIGLAISAAARSQIQAVQSAVLVYLPSMVLSGFLFPFANMPDWAQRLGAVFPLTYYNEVARGVMLRGTDAAFVHARMWPVVAIAAGSLAVAIASFRRRLS